MRRLGGAALCVMAVVGGALAGVASAAPQPADWCGPGESAADLPDTVGGLQIHVIYAYPADAPDNFGRWVTPIARDLASVDSWWRQQDATRTLRFDFAAFPGCDTAFGALDISSVRLSNVSEHYQVDELEVVDVLAADLEATFASTGKKYLVYFDGPVESGAVCGRGASGPSLGASAVVYLQSQAVCVRAGGGVGVPGGAVSAVLAVHELIHTLDDVPTTGPHKCPDGGRHYCDDPNDILAPSASGASRLATSVLDSGRDDYYGNGGPSDVRNSPFLAHLDAPTVRLATAVATPGGRITSDLPGMVCPGVCDLPWDAGTTVGLLAQADAGYAFAGWGGAFAGSAGAFAGWDGAFAGSAGAFAGSAGACAGIAPSCKVTLASDTTVTARFGRPGKLLVRIDGRGSVDRCSSTCRQSIVSGQQLTLRASPKRAAKFVRWEGACRGIQRECTIAAEPGTTVRAVFTAA